VDVAEKTVHRLEELIEAGRGIAQDDAGGLRRWLTSARNLMLNFVGTDTTHCQAFEKLYADWGDDYFEPDIDQTKEMVGILEATRDDIAAGFMFKRDLLISAANFGDILEQAEHLLSSDYKNAAAVLIGAVLEGTLRRLCERRELPYTAKDTMEPLNVKLAKDGAYESMTQKMITTWGDLRNKAAHGHFEKYTDAEVRQMLQWVSGFVEQHLR